MKDAYPGVSNLFEVGGSHCGCRRAIVGLLLEKPLFPLAGSVVDCMC